MFKSLATLALRTGSCIARRHFRVCVYGAAGGVGHCLSLLLKRHPLVTELGLYDLQFILGNAVDMSHIDTDSKVTGFTGPDKLKEALSGSDIVVIPAGVPRKPGMRREDLLPVNGKIIMEACTAIAKYCPEAMTAIITNPVNSMVPIAAEVMKKAGVFCEKRLFGITHLDVVRTRKFISEITGTPCDKICVPVIGGHTATTILPILSQAEPKLKLEPEKLRQLTERIQNAGTEVVEAKKGTGSATFSTAHAAMDFTDRLLKALTGANVQTYAYIPSGVTICPFFSSGFVLGKAGIEKFLELPKMNLEELTLLNEACCDILDDIERGIKYAGQHDSTSPPKCPDSKPPPNAARFKQPPNAPDSKKLPNDPDSKQPPNAPGSKPRQMLPVSNNRRTLMIPNNRQTVLIPNNRQTLLVPTLRETLPVSNERQKLMIPNNRQTLLVPNPRETLLIPKNRQMFLIQNHKKLSKYEIYEY